MIQKYQIFDLTFWSKGNIIFFERVADLRKSSFAIRSLYL